jgi:hypothetical protein
MFKCILPACFNIYCHYVERYTVSMFKVIVTIFNGILSLCLNIHCHYVENYAVSVFKSILSLCLNIYCHCVWKYTVSMLSVYCHYISTVLCQNHLRWMGDSTRSSHGHKIETTDQISDQSVTFYCTTYWRIIMDIKMSSVISLHFHVTFTLINRFHNKHPELCVVRKHFYS